MIEISPRAGAKVDGALYGSATGVVNRPSSALGFEFPDHYLDVVHGYRLQPEHDLLRRQSSYARLIEVLQQTLDQFLQYSAKLGSIYQQGHTWSAPLVLRPMAAGMPGAVRPAITSR